jgi:hypothetical protein
MADVECLDVFFAEVDRAWEGSHDLSTGRLKILVG